MSQIFSIVLQQSILGLLLFGLVYSLDQLIQKKTFNTWRSFVWTLYFVFLIIPVQWLVATFLPKKSLPPVLFEVPLEASMPSSSVGSTVAQFSWLDGAAYGWGIGVIIALIFFIIIPFVKERQMRHGLVSQSQPLSLGDRGGSSLFFVDNETLPFVSGLFRSKIFIPKTLVKHLDQEQLKSVLLHEKAHVINKDLLKILLARFSMCVFWFSPFVYMAYYKMREAQEYVADQYALSQNKQLSQGEYSKTLLKVSMLGELEAWGAFGVSILNKSHLRKRIEAVSAFNPSAQRRILFPIALVALVVGVSLSVFRLGSFGESANDVVTVVMEVKNGNKVIARPRIVSQLGQEAMMYVKNDDGFAWSFKAVPKSSGNFVTLAGIICEEPQSTEGVENLKAESFVTFDCKRKLKFEVATNYGESVAMDQKEHFNYRFKILKGAQIDATFGTQEENHIPKVKEDRNTYVPPGYTDELKSKDVIDQHFGINTPKKC